MGLADKQPQVVAEQIKKHRLTFILPFLVFIIGVLILGALTYQLESSQNSVIRSKAELNAVYYADNMKRDIDRGIAVTETVKQIVIAENGAMPKFNAVAENMMHDFIQSIQLAPGGVVTEIYPAEGNEAGKIDLINDVNRGRISRYARDTGRITIQGPFPLKQGGQGIAIRNPVYLEKDNGQKKFWGFTIVIIRVPEIFSDSIKPLAEFGYEYKLSKSIAPWDNSFKEVFASGAELHEPAVYNFVLGDSNWRLEVMPQTGWSSNKNIYVFLGCGILIVLLLSALIVVLLLLQKARASEKQTAELNRELQEALALANVANVAKTKFINNMSHDIRTLMNAVLGFTKIALTDKLEAKTRSYLNKINQSSLQLLSFIDDVLEMADSKSSKKQLQLAPTALKNITADVVELAQGLIADRKLELVADSAALDGINVLADAGVIRKALANVISNAVKFTDDGGKIKFTTAYILAEDKKHILVTYTITDNGIGMSDEFQKHVFEEFTQEIPAARTQYKGTGTGLAITKNCVELLGGTIALQSKIGQGTSVTIKLSLKLINDENVGKMSAAEAVRDYRGLHVLLVEDNKLNMEIAKSILESKGIDVTCAWNGQEAVECFSASQVKYFDVILMDIMMPVLDGCEAAKLIRAMQRTDAVSVPVIAISAGTFAEAAGGENIFSAYLLKPLDVEKLFAVIDRLTCRK